MFSWDRNADATRAEHIGTRYRSSPVAEGTSDWGKRGAARPTLRGLRTGGGGHRVGESLRRRRFTLLPFHSRMPVTLTASKGQTNKHLISSSAVAMVTGKLRAVTS